MHASTTAVRPKVEFNHLLVIRKHLRISNRRLHLVWVLISDFDNWAANGAAGWSFADLEPSVVMFSTLSFGGRVPEIDKLMGLIADTSARQKGMHQVESRPQSTSKIKVKMVLGELATAMKLLYAYISLAYSAPNSLGDTSSLVGDKQNP